MTTYLVFVNLSDMAGSYLAGQAVAYGQVPTLGLLAGGLAWLSRLGILLVLHRYTDLSSTRKDQLIDTEPL